MERIGVRELRQNASVYLRRVQSGESFEVTERGRPVALLNPVAPMSTLERLLADGLITEAEGDMLDVAPVELPAGAPTLSQLLDELRNDER